MDFEAYLISKRIDSSRFSSAEPDLWQSWRVDFEQMHPNSFTVQKLNLINPIRRKYQLAVTETTKKVTPPVAQTPASPIAKTIVKVPRPGMSKVPPPEVVEPTATVTVTASSDANTPARETPDEATSSADLPMTSAKVEPAAVPDNSVPVVKPAKPVIPRPVIKPKPKTN